jgi:hypothetical protein
VSFAPKSATSIEKSRACRHNAPVSILSSPRRRRRLAWLGGTLGVVAVVAVVIAVVPNHGGPAKGVRVAPQAPAFGETTQRPTVGQEESPAEIRARQNAERTVRSLAVTFVDDLLRRHDLPRAYALLSPDLQQGASLHDWQTGRFLPLSATGSGGSLTIAFSGATTVGVVSEIGNNVLFAMRFDKTKGRWLIGYLHQGHSSSRVDAANYAPAGFLPGSHVETFWTWLALIGGFFAIVAVAVVFEQWLRGSRT